MTNFYDVGCMLCGFSSICASLPAKQIESIVNRRVKLKRNETLVSFQQSFNSLFAVRYGLLKSFDDEVQQTERIIGFYFAGEIAGLEAIHTGYYPFSMTAVKDTIVCRIPFENVMEISSVLPTIQRRLLNIVGSQIHHSLYVRLLNAEQRLASFLLDLIKRLHLKNNVKVLELPLSRLSIANYLGLAAETVSRVFHRWEKMAILRINNKQLLIHNLEKLKQITTDHLTE